MNITYSGFRLIINFKCDNKPNQYIFSALVVCSTNIIKRMWKKD